MGVLMAWFAAIGLQTVRDVKYGDPPHAPLPSEYVASGLWFGAWALVDGFARPVGSLVAWGTLLALFLQVEAAGGTGHPFTDFVSNGAPAPVGTLFPGTGTTGAGSTSTTNDKGKGFVPASVRGAQQR